MEPADRPWLTPHYLMFGQGLYYFVAGLWPIVSLSSFLAVTGPKTDTWLVQSFGAIVALLGVVFLIGAVRRMAALELIVLSLGIATILLIADLVFVIDRVILPVYLLDAALELFIAVAWIVLLKHERTVMRQAI